MSKNERILRKILTTEKEVVCINEGAYIATLALGLQMSMAGKTVTAKVKKGY